MPEIRFSIVIPSYNRHEQIVRCLTALTKVDCPKDSFEVVVVDDGSEIPYEGYLEPFKSKLNVVSVRQANAGVGSARNCGVRNARGKFLIFIDDDCFAHPDWLRNMEKVCVEGSREMVGGKIVNGYPQSAYCRAAQFILDAVYASYESDPDTVLFLNPNNMALQKIHYDDVGGYDACFGTLGSEDREFCDRWRMRGGKLKYVPEAVLFHSHPLNFGQYLRKYFNYGRGDFLYSRSPARRKDGIVLQMLGHHVRILKLFVKTLGQRSLKESLELPVLLLAWQAATFAGFLWQGLLSFVAPPAGHQRS